jgi:hypothetical protein
MTKSYSKKTKKAQFLYNPENLAKSRDIFNNDNPADTIHIKYTTLQDVKNTISTLEHLYKAKKHTHKRISQVAMILKVRLALLKDIKPQEYKLANRYFEFIKQRTPLSEKERHKIRFTV